jgi:predicted RNA binding protein YcfA (HicA-like mRNA interferase family)
MKIPRDVSAADLIQVLRPLGYVVTRQTGSHIRITTERDGRHHETIPNHTPLKVGTVHSLLKSIAAHHHHALAELVDDLVCRDRAEPHNPNRIFVAAPAPRPKHPSSGGRFHALAKNAVRLAGFTMPAREERSA